MHQSLLLPLSPYGYQKSDIVSGKLMSVVTPLRDGNRYEKEKESASSTCRRHSRWNEAGASLNTDPSSDERQRHLNIVKCRNYYPVCQPILKYVEVVLHCFNSVIEFDTLVSAAESSANK
ncbi:hypothetical protein TNCV_3774951 [Trichonephila clavipes]|nr:hypothetical protein TNCV_3774951 [Trichonephila clavipes]